MKRLLWKEFRERGWWALAWALAILGISLFSHGQSFYGEQTMLTSPLQALPLILGLLAGAGAYSSELARSHSVFSRPITPRTLLAAKLLFAAIVCLGAPLLAAVITWCVAPEPYRHLATPSNMLLGALGVAWKYWLVYLLGLSCSVVVPSLAGGILTLAAALLPLIAALALVDLYLFSGYVQGSSASVITENLHRYAGRSGWVFGAWLGITIAGLSITRFAVVLSNDERIKRFTIVFLPLFLICGIAGMLMPSRVAARLFLHREIGWTHISPKGQYALVTEFRRPINIVLRSLDNPGASFGHARYLVRMNDGMRLSLPNIDFEWWRWNLDWNWITDEIACAYVLNKERLYLIYPGSGESREVSLPGKVIKLHTVSPDGRLLPLEIRSERKVPIPKTSLTAWKPYRQLITIDIPTGQILDEREVSPNLPYIWWHDNRTLAYRNSLSRKSETQYWRIRKKLTPIPLDATMPIQ